MATPLLQALLLLLGGAAAKKNLVPNAHVAIDFGSQFIKIATEQSVRGHKKSMLLKNAQPMVLNAEGARKTPNVIAFRDGAILYGVQALSSQARFPDRVFAQPSLMLGQPSSSTGPPWFTNHGYHYRWAAATTRGTVRVDTCCPELSLEAEVLSGLLLKHCQDSIDAQLKGVDFNATNVVLPVPPYWTQNQRAALHDAAGLAGLSGGGGRLELVDSHVALAFKYAMKLRLLQDAPKEDSATHTALLIDVGASGVTASVVAFQAVRKGDKIRERARVKGLGWVSAVQDPEAAGGHAVDARLARHLAGVYAEQLRATCGGDGDIGDGAPEWCTAEAATADLESVWGGDARVSTMLMIAATKCKEVLSANKEKTVTIEGLPVPGSGSLDGALRTAVSRSELEDLIREIVVERWVHGAAATAIEQSGAPAASHQPLSPSAAAAAALLCCAVLYCTVLYCVSQHRC